METATHIRICANPDCGRKMSSLNRGDLCYTCQGLKQAQRVNLIAGAGKGPYKLHAAQLPAAPVAAAVAPPQPTEERPSRMDKLICRVIDATDIPRGSKAVRASTGRIGQLWERLVALPPQQALEVSCRDIPHVGYTARQVRLKAKQQGRELRDCEREGKMLFVSLKPKGSEVVHGRS